MEARNQSKKILFHKTKNRKLICIYFSS